MTRGTSTTTECISAWSDLMDAGSKDCALATVVVQTIPPMNQVGVARVSCGSITPIARWG